MKFASVFDQRSFHDGPPAIFTLDPRGQLRIDPERTREGYLLVEVPLARDPGVFVLTDRATGVMMVLVVSHRVLALCQPRGRVDEMPDFASAVAKTVEQWSVSAPDAVPGADEQV